MAIDIQSLTVKQLDEALQVWEATLGGDFKLDRQEVADRLQHGAGIFYVAVDGETGRMVGIKFGFIDGEVCIGRGIAVLPAYRRQGIATRLILQFEQELHARPAIKVYAFGSDSTEGIPFHIAAGYFPQALIQLTDRELRAALDLSGFVINHEGFNEQYQVYQIFTALDSSQANFDTLRSLQAQYPQVSIQYFFKKTIKR